MLLTARTGLLSHLAHHEHWLFLVLFQLSHALLELDQRNVDRPGDMALIELLLVPDVDDHGALAVDQHYRLLRADRLGRGARMIYDNGQQGNHPHTRQNRVIAYEFNELRHAGRACRWVAGDGKPAPAETGRQYTLTTTARVGSIDREGGGSIDRKGVGPSTAHGWAYRLHGRRMRRPYKISSASKSAPTPAPL